MEGCGSVIVVCRCDQKYSAFHGRAWSPWLFHLKGDICLFTSSTASAEGECNRFQFAAYKPKISDMFLEVKMHFYCGITLPRIRNPWQPYFVNYFPMVDLMFDLMLIIIGPRLLSHKTACSGFATSFESSPRPTRSRSRFDSRISPVVKGLAAHNRLRKL